MSRSAYLDGWATGLVGTALSSSRTRAPGVIASRTRLRIRTADSSSQSWTIDWST